MSACSLTRVVLACVLSAVVARAQEAPVQGQERPRTLVEDLDLAARLVAPNERKNAALAIARRKDANVPALLAAIESIVARGPERAPVDGEAHAAPSHAPGTHVEHATLFADGKREETELIVYVPRSFDESEPAPLILAFHGTGGSGSGLDATWGATAEKLGALVVAPTEAGANEGYAFSLRERDAAIAALRWTKLHFRVDSNRVYATGVSRGGHLVWDVALRRPDRFAALAPMIGCPRFQLVRGQNNLRFLENVAHVPIRDLQGSKDDPGVLQNLHEAFATLTKFGARDAKLIEFADKGHSFEFGAVDWVEFFGSARRDPDPERVVLTAANLTEARAYGVEIVGFTKDVAENPRIDVAASAWSKLDAAGQRRFIQQQIEADTARIVVTRTAKGKFVVEAKGVARFRLLLTREGFDPAVPVEVTFGGKVTKRKVALDPKVMVTEWVERLDPAFLPVAVIEVP